jgi:putative transposase
MEQVIKVRLYPTKEQADFLNRQFGCVRLVYNKALGIINHQYRVHGRGLSAKHDVKKLLPIAKKSNRYAFLKECDSLSLQQSCNNLDKAFKKFFEKKAGYPKFKKKQSRQSSYHINVTVEQSEDRKRGYLKIPKLSTPIKAVLHRKIPEGKIKSVTLSKDPSGKYYASMLFSVERVVLETSQSIQENQVVGIDMGIKDLLITSKKQKVANPRFYIKALKELRRKQKALSRCVKGSRGYEIARLKVAKCHEKVRKTREDLQHKLSLQLISENQVIVVETLKVKNMLKNRRLAKHIADASWSRFITMLEYKAKLYGKRLIKIDQWFASSKTCSCCGYKRKTLPLQVRFWTCPECQTAHDRDINASVNIKQQGIIMLKAEGLSVSVNGV